MAANTILFDRALRHQIGIRRFTAQEVRKALELFEKADAELTAQLRVALAKLGGQRSVTSERFAALLADLNVARNELMLTYRKQTRGMIHQFAQVEADFERDILERTIPFDIEFASVQLDSVRASIRSKPFSGGSNSARTLNQWFESLASSDKGRLLEGIQLGVTQGESIDTVVRRIIGTRANGYTDGILAVTRRNAETITRTAINHVSNTAREAVWDENSDIIEALRWVATLDGRTSAICRARDGHLAVFGDGKLPRGFSRLDPPTARPPAHPNCRSLLIAILDIDGLTDIIGERPFVRDARSSKQRQKDFRADARNRDPDKWKSLDAKERNALIKKEKRRFVEDAVGRVPENVNYNDWLKRQPANFQDTVLGKTKGKLFRTGRINLDQYVDRRGNELTIAQLKNSHPEIFEEIGL